MRYGLISDIHGNLPALRVALTELRGRGIDGLLCMGDIVGYGPWPNQCVAEVASQGAVCVAGNQDLMVVDRLPDVRLSEHARLILDWTRTVLDRDAVSYLAGLPFQERVAPGLRLAHGSLEDPERYIFRIEDAAQQMNLLDEVDPTAEKLLLGHTHKAMVYGQTRGMGKFSPRQPIDLAEDKHLLNPGSIGQSRERKPWARAALLDLDIEQVTFFALDYNLESCRRELIRLGLPPGACHARPSLVSLAHRFADRHARRATRSLRRFQKTSGREV